MQRSNVLYAGASLAALVMIMWFGAYDAEQRDIALEPEAYRAWCARAENGLARSRSVNGLTLTMRYQPPEYLAWQQLRRRSDRSARMRDSLIKRFSAAKRFLLTIAPDERHGGGDVTMRGVQSYGEFAERVERLNFELRDYITLKTEAGLLTPALAVLEHTQGLRPSRTVNLAFVPDDEYNDFYDSEIYDVTFNDRIFHTGINHFVFRRSDLDAVPRLAYAIPE